MQSLATREPAARDKRDLLRTIAEGTAGSVGAAFLRSLSRSLAAAFAADVAYVAELERRRHEAALCAREAEVAASRTRLLHAADEERRRIGRELHDGAQQRLVVLGQCLDLALRSAEQSPEDAARLITAAREQATLAGRELRELSRGLHPAGLTAHGLASALRSLGLNSPVPLRIEAVPEQRLPDPVEVTVYYLVAEALSNAVKHAGATEVRVDLQRRGPVLHAEIADDGVGGAEAGGAGTGLPGLVDRLEALGGRLEVESAPGAGTRLRASIPLAPWRDGREPFIEFGYEGDSGQGERAIGQIVDGTKTVSVSLAREWDLEGGPPRIGQRVPITDHHGSRRAVVEVTRVAVLPFGQIDAAVVSAESAGSASLEEWMASHRAFFAGCRDEVALLLGEPGWRLTDAEPMVVTSFRHARPRRGSRAAGRSR